VGRHLDPIPPVLAVGLRHSPKGQFHKRVPEDAYKQDLRYLSRVDLGYARVSTTLQDPALQVDAMNVAGCCVVSAPTSRPVLEPIART